jgi:opacity protein-like surface antigen
MALPRPFLLVVVALTAAAAAAAAAEVVYDRCTTLAYAPTVRLAWTISGGTLYLQASTTLISVT